MKDFAFTLETLNQSHYADLAALKANPRHPMTTSRRDLLRRLGLIVAIEPPREALDSRKRKPPARRAYRITEVAETLLTARPEMIGQVGRVGWGA